jgi:hypothetical protein
MLGEGVEDAVPPQPASTVAIISTASSRLMIALGLRFM